MNGPGILSCVLCGERDASVGRGLCGLCYDAHRRVLRDRLAGMRALDAAVLVRHVPGPPRMSTSRRIRRNALRELARRLRWGRGAGRKSFAETLRSIDADRVVADPRVRDQEIALLIAATRGGV